ncbi:class I SAM-dependent methyltransferase [Leptothermofonsia sp. ETS-13]|uniref:class I SAM-dependent methyltransferase n=1 Tax=Leptothermofonsia sp. ETS-13 TaxID=3035696 RepID=UPI003BA01D9F
MLLHNQGEKINQKSLIISGFLAVFFLIFSLLLWIYLKELSIVFIIATLLFLITFIQLEAYYRNQKVSLQQNEQLFELLELKSQADNHYRQIEALFSIFNLLALRHPLPPMRGWAVSPDFMKLVISSVFEHKPRLVVELGSGVSTLVVGYCLQKLNQGEVISVDHEESYTEITKNSVLNHSLQNVVQVIYAPLKNITIYDKTWLWYDPSFLTSLEQPIDLLIIDGPPGDLQKLSRYPALPLLIDSLSDNALVLLDDSNREDEQEIVKLWKQNFSLSKVEQIVTEKGAHILQLSKK